MKLRGADETASADESEASKRFAKSASVFLADASFVCLLGCEFVFTTVSFVSRALLTLAPDILPVFWRNESEINGSYSPSTCSIE